MTIGRQQDADDSSGAPGRELGALEWDPVSSLTMLEERYSALDDVLAGVLPAVIVPAARLGRHAAARLIQMGVNVVAFGDRSPELHGTRIDGLPVLSPAEVAAVHGAHACLVASTMYDSDIAEDLRARGCQFVVPVGYLNLRLPDVFMSREYRGAWSGARDSANRPTIEEAYGLFEENESRRVFAGKLAFYLSLEKQRLEDIKSPGPIYFDPSVYALEESEVVVDGGAFTGDTLTSFLEISSRRFDAYVAFEPDAGSFATLLGVAGVDPTRITSVRAGLGRHTTSARLSSTEGPDSRLLDADEPGGSHVRVVSLDDYFDGRRPPTLIKMDIEGGEAEALLGAAGLLADTPPTLAISAYHFPYDLWRLPTLIHRLMPDSRLYLRHYGREVDDTVCYAVPRTTRA